MRRWKWQNKRLYKKQLPIKLLIPGYAAYPPPSFASEKWLIYSGWSVMLHFSQKYNVLQLQPLDLPCSPFPIQWLSLSQTYHTSIFALINLLGTARITTDDFLRCWYVQTILPRNLGSIVCTLLNPRSWSVLAPVNVLQ